MDDKQSVPRIRLSDAVVGLERVTEDLPHVGWHFTDWPFGRAVMTRALAEDRLLQGLRDAIELALVRCGLVVVNCWPILANQPEDRATTMITFLVSMAGRPFRAVLEEPHWRQLTVDLDRPSDRSRGAGLHPMHIDFVNMAEPPDIVCLLCLRPDPLGGGDTLAAPFDEVWTGLTQHNLELLRSPIYRFGEARNLDGVGLDISPFAVLSAGNPWWFRFTAKLRQCAPNEEAAAALDELYRHLTDRLIRVRLRAGELILLDQHRVVHGRAPLGSGQDGIPQHERRLLLQSFVRRAPAPRD